MVYCTESFSKDACQCTVEKLPAYNDVLGGILWGVVFVITREFNHSQVFILKSNSESMVLHQHNAHSISQHRQKYFEFETTCQSDLHKDQGLQLYLK